jgi:drug/metabolite transporter (DMT)-like permease
MYSVTATVVLAMVASLVFGMSSVLEQRSTKQVPERGALQPRLLVDLLKRPMWIAAIALEVVGSLLQIFALHFGPLALVQPILVCSLLFAVLIAAVAFRHRAPDGIMALGVVCATAGISCFLAVARPSGGVQTVSPVTILPLGVGLAAVLAVCLAAAHFGPSNGRPLMLALACGVDFGVTAFLLKLVSYTVPQGFGDPLRQWPLYALVIVGPVGFLLNQNAFQAGILISPVLAVITVADPLVSIGIAHIWLHEAIADTPLDIAAEVISLAVMTVGIFALAHRAPHAALAADRPVVRR